MIISDTTPIWQLTVAEFKSLIREAQAQETKSERPVETQDEYVYGISGLAEFLNCSKTTAQKLKSSGRIDKAITQVGRQIIINKKQVINILKN
jgi:hypothetical protein